MTQGDAFAYLPGADGFAMDVWDLKDTEDRARRMRPPAGTPSGSAEPVDVLTIGDPAKYAASALLNAHTELANIGEGGRNHALNTIAFSLGKLVAARPPLASAEDVETCLLDACERNGLLGEDGHYTTINTIRSGLAGGARDPLRWTLDAAPAVPAATPFLAASIPAQRDGEAPPIDPDALHKIRVSAELANLRARDDARTLLDNEKAARDFRVPPSRWTVREELLLPEEDVSYAVDDLLPSGGNALLTAAFKIGKTTVVGDLAAAHADGDKFLGKFTVAPSAGRLAIFNYELSEGQYRRWLRELAVKNPERLAVLHLRGFRLPLIVPSVEDWIVQWLSEREVTRWVVDPFARAFTGCGDENDNGHVGRFLDTLDVVKERAGVTELILPTHTGRMQHEVGQERARGATRLDDWADVRWMLTADDDGKRFFSANGRDVDEAEELLHYDEPRRRLRKEGGDRRTTKTRGVEERVLAAVNATPGIGASALRDAVRATGTATNDAIGKAVKDLVRAHKIRVEVIGKNHLHHPGGAVPYAYEPSD